MSSPEVLATTAARLAGTADVDVSLAPASTYRVGGPAALSVVIDDAETLDRVARTVAETGVEVLVIGNGSNLLVADAGFAGLAIRLGPTFSSIAVDGTAVRSGGGALLPVVARRTVAAGLTGFEWAVGVPGSMGGAVRMNAGGHGSDMAASVVRVRVLDLRTGDHGTVPAAELAFDYRSSTIGSRHLVTEVELALDRLESQAPGSQTAGSQTAGSQTAGAQTAGSQAPGSQSPGSQVAGEELLSEIVRWRRSHQPGGQNAGSVFTNPPGDSAGRLIEAAGLKGHRHGSAAVSTKHANFIQADPDGRADDVFALMVEIRDAVEAASGVRLHPETVLIGYDRSVFA